MESEFYVTLPSNSSMEYFPDNKTSNLVTKPSRTLQLDGECQVGLAEIDYPHNWYNIREGKNSVEIYTADKLFLVFKTVDYCLTKISIRAKRSISRVFSLFIVPSPFFVHCPYKGRINRAESVLTGLKPY